MTKVRNVIICIAMLATAILSMTLKPTQKVANSTENVNLEKIIPKEFGDWKVVSTVIPIQLSEAQEKLIKKLYQQSLSRTYLNNQQQRVMLSVVYGGEQSDSLQVHKPEMCYQAQGFDILKIVKSKLSTKYGQIPIKRVLAVQGNRNEPITYWFTVGNRVVSNNFDFKLQQLNYGLRGEIPDGILFRISSINSDETEAYKLEDKFVIDLLKVISVKDRVRLMGAV